MAEDKVSIKIIPTPATHEISQNDLLRLARLTKIPVDRIRDRISRGKSITIVTTVHPRVQDLVNMVKSIGFSVVTGPADPVEPADGTTRQKAEKAAEDVEWQVGEVIENLYEVRDIKHGGMGAVYVVRHRRWNTMMAVKSLLKRLQDREEDRALFLKEAETWIDIGFHPNIAACYYVRNISESPRIFIEYVDGGALNHWLSERSPVGWDLLLDLMVQFCDGLEHAHKKGLVHRDVKPGNCMMTRNGILKVTDFGLTKRRTVESFIETDPGGSPTDSLVFERESITAAGMGTPGYMAPEMWIPHSDVGPAVDIYAFGVMFFEICCGRKPFVVKPGERRDKLALAHVKKPPPMPSAFRKDIPKAVEELILNCLKKTAEERPASFRHVRSDLASIYEDLVRKKYLREPPDEVRLFSDALNNRAVSLMDLNHGDEAKLALARALENDPHHPEAVYNKGLLDWARTGDPGWDLVTMMQEVIKTPVYVTRGAPLLARCLLTLGDAEKALKACEASLSPEEAEDDRLKHYGIALVGSGRDEEAVAPLEGYLKEFPNDDEAIGWLIGALLRSGRPGEAAVRMKSLPEGSELAGKTAEQISESFGYTGLRERLVIKGHAGWVTSVRELPKSGMLLTASRDRTIRLWDKDTGVEKKTISIVGQPPDLLWISSDERLAAMTDAKPGAQVKFLDLESGKFVGKPLSHEGSISALGFSADGGHILTVDQKGALRVWETSQGKAVATHKIPSHTASALVSVDATRPEVIIAGIDRMLKRYKPPDQEPVVFERGHRDPITAVKMTPDGKTVVSTGRDRQVIVWDGMSGKPMRSFQLHQEQVLQMAVNPVKPLVATYDTKSGIKVWETQTGTVFRTFTPGEAEIHALVFSADGNRLIAGGKDMTVRVWEVGGRPVRPEMALAKILPVTKQMKSDKKFKTKIELAKEVMKKGDFQKAHGLLRETQKLAGYERSELALDMLLRLKDHACRIGVHGGWKKKGIETQSGAMDVAFSPSGIYFLTAQADHSVRLWSTKTGECLKTLRDHTNLVSAVRFSPNGREAISGSDDRTVRVWDLNSGRNTVVSKGHLESVTCVAYSQDGAAAASGSWDGSIRLWRMPDGAPLKTLKAQDDKINCVAFLHGADYVFSGGSDGSIRMWEVSSGRVVRELKGHVDRVTCLRVSPSGDLLLSVSMDGTARLWDSRRGRDLSVVAVSTEGLRTAAFAPDQRFFITGGADAVLRLWTTDACECLREFQGHTKEITGVDFSANGRFIISSSTDASVMLWEIDWEWSFDEDDTKPAHTNSLRQT